MDNIVLFRSCACCEQMFFTDSSRFIACWQNGVMQCKGTGRMGPCLFSRVFHCTLSSVDWVGFLNEGTVIHHMPAANARRIVLGLRPLGEHRAANNRTQ